MEPWSSHAAGALCWVIYNAHRSLELLGGGYVWFQVLNRAWKVELGTPQVLHSKLKRESDPLGMKEEPWLSLQSSANLPAKLQPSGNFLDSTQKMEKEEISSYWLLIFLLS